MSTEYKIESDGAEFILTDDVGETVGVYPTREAAEEDLARHLKKDGMWDTATCLVGIAIKAFMKIHSVDRETAERAIRDAMGGA